MNQRNLSNKAIHLTNQAKHVAKDLGYEAVSTLHLLIADCEANSPGSIANFAFADKAAFDKFKNECKKSKPLWSFNQKATALKLTKEYSDAFWRSGSLDLNYSNNLIQPAHIFLAAMDDKSSEVFNFFSAIPDCKSKLHQYYSTLGVFDIQPGSSCVEQQMDTQENNRIQLEINALLDDKVHNHQCNIVLANIAQKRKIVIVVGKEEAVQLSLAISKLGTEKSVVRFHNLLHSVIIATGYHLQEMYIDRVESGNLFSKIVISNDAQQIALDAGTADALTLATMTNVPIFINASLFDSNSS